MAHLDTQWLNISEDRLKRFEAMFRWNDETAHYYDGARIGPGLVLADFGCGPGHQAIEFARRVAPGGHVHALDINPEFIARTREKADAAGLGGNVTAHLIDGAALPLDDASLDRVIVRNTLIHVPGPADCISEFHRALKPGGLAHMIEGDRRLMAVEPVEPSEWVQLIDAAEWAWKQPVIGRRLYGLARAAGFADCKVEVLTAADNTGRLLGMIRTIGDYAIEGGMDASTVEQLIGRIEAAVSDGRYLAISPQFVVTAFA